MADVPHHDRRRDHTRLGSGRHSSCTAASSEAIRPNPSTWGPAPATNRLVCSTYGPYATLTAIRSAAGPCRQRTHPSAYVPVTTVIDATTSTVT